MQAHLSIPVARIKVFQDLVKQHDLRFIGNPLVIGEKAWVDIDSDHLPPGECNKFFTAWDRLNTNIRETRSPRWKRMLRRLGMKL